MLSNEEKSLKERIKSLIKERGITIKSLSHNKSEQVMIGKQMGDNDTSVPYSTLRKVLKACPDVDANWLLTGDGPMLKSEQVNTTAIQNQEPAMDTEGMRNRIKELEKDKEFLMGVVAALTRGAKSDFSR